MTPKLIAMIFFPCISPSYDAVFTRETVVYACPESVKFVYDAPMVEQVDDEVIPAAIAPPKPTVRPAGLVKAKAVTMKKKTHKHRKKRKS